MINLIVFRKKLTFLIGCVFVFFACLCFSNASIAKTGYCKTIGGPMQFSDNMGNHTITNPDDDYSGKILMNIYSWDKGGAYSTTCDCDVATGSHESYFKTDTTLPFGHQQDGLNFYTVNDYIQVATTVWLGGGVAQFVPTPWSNISNKDSADNTIECGGNVMTSADTGSKGKLSIYIARPFIGTSAFLNVKLLDIYRSNTSNSFGGEPVAIVYMSGQITVPQTCTLNAGQIVTVDFGDVWSGKFKTKGQKPDGVNAKTVTFPVTCNGGVESTANLTARFQSTPDANYPDAISSDNPDVGVMITDTNGRTIEPNTGLIPFSLENSQATVSFKAYPVSTTGKAPTEGKFTSLAYIRVDFA